MLLQIILLPPPPPTPKRKKKRKKKSIRKTMNKNKKKMFILTAQFCSAQTKWPTCARHPSLWEIPHRCLGNSASGFLDAE